MKVRLYNDNSQKIFSIYPFTLSAYFVQPPIEHESGVGFNQIFAITCGNGMLRLDDKVYEVQADDMFFIPKGISHEYRGYTDDFATCFMSFDGYGCRKLMDYFEVCESGFCKGKITPYIYSEFKEMYSEFLRMSTAKLCARAYCLAVDFFEEALRHEILPVDSVLDYIEENYSKQITLDDIMSVYPYSKSKLCRDFYEKYSVTVFEKLTEIRLRHAYFLIKNQSELKIKSISEMCGYTDVSYFCRMFKRTYGRSPDSVRRI